MSLEVQQYAARRGPPGPRRPWRVVVVVAVIVIGFVAAYLTMRAFVGFINRAVGGDQTAEVVPGRVVEVRIPRGSSAEAIADLLVEQGVISSVREFENAVRAGGVTDELKAGVYEMTTGTDLDEVIDALVAGPTEATVFRVTVIEGLTIEQMLGSLAEQTEFTVDELAAPLLDGTVASDLLLDPPEELTDWEGVLFPDTYEIAFDARPAEVVRLLASTAVARVNSVDWSELEELGMTPYDGVIVASLIEEEAAIDEDRPLIASVIYNRLAAGMRLEIDATVLYALGEHRPALTLDDLEVDSPYNTYRHDGLPPTPIAGVRLASLQAAAHPAETDYLYYVLVDASGEHGFTADPEEFAAMKQQARADGLIP
ncbi:MAG: endolytic transglycosylase MltG [Acidimicrobiia bacterium]